LKTTTLKCNIDGVRLDVYLAENIDGMTRSAAGKLLETGNVMLNSASLRKNHKTSSGDIYIITQDEPIASAAVAQDIWLNIVYEDNDLIVINKPRGLVVHPAPGHPDNTLVNALLYHCGDSLSGIGGVIRPGIVHRLDKDTSGLIIAAKNDHAHLSLAAQLSSRTLIRIYDAVVCGIIKNDNGTIDAPIGRHPTNRKKQKAYSPGEASVGRSSCGVTVRNATTHYSVIARYDGYTHVRCQLETGRTHQIRVHMAYIGHSILGDTVYGKKKFEFNINSQCLHARKLSFLHPVTNEQISLSTILPDYFVELLSKLEKR